MNNNEIVQTYRTRKKLATFSLMLRKIQRINLNKKNPNIAKMGVKINSES